MKFLISFAIIFLSSKASAYPTYIRLNYTSCISCHQSVEGGGPLTSYGKGIATTESYTGGEYKPVVHEMFLNMYGKMEHSAQERFMGLTRLYDYSGKKQRFFPMQLDYTNQIKWKKDLRQEITLGVAPNTAKLKGIDSTDAKKTSWTKRIYLRTFKLDYSYDKNNRIVVGGANLPLGLRLVDHTAYVRERNRLAVNDVPIQLQYMNLSREWIQTYIAYVPNPSDNEANREKGLVTKQEYYPFTNWAVGSQALYADGKSINRGLVGAYTRWGKGPFAVLSEIDFTKRQINEVKTKVDQWASLIEGHYFIKEYLRTSLGFQALRVNTPFKEKEEMYTFNNEFKVSPRISFILEYRQKSTDLQLEKTLFAQVFVNGW